MIDYTIDAPNRPDLVSAVAKYVNPPFGYIGNRLLPISWCADKSGSLYYKTLVTDSAAQTSRSAGAAPTATILATSSTTFTTAEYIKRYGIAPDEVKEMGGIESADRYGACASIRSVWRAYESAVAALAITNTTHSAGYQLVANHVLTGLQAAAAKVRRYPGRTVLFCSQDWFLDLIEQTDVVQRIVATFGNAALTSLADRSGQPEMLLKMMATLLRIDEILVGDNDHWKVTGYEEDAVIAKVLPAGINTNQDEIRMAYKLDPLYGVTKWYTPDVSSLTLPEGVKAEDLVNGDGIMPLTAFQLSSYFDKQLKASMYDAVAWFKPVVLNTGAAVVVSLPAGEIYATTTSHA